MFSGLLEPLRRNIALRLSLWYASVFTLSSLALLSLAYYLLANAVGGKDREVLEARLKEASAIYQNGGIRALESWIQSQPPEVRQTLFVRWVNVMDNMVVISPPPSWVTFRDVPTGWAGYRRRERIIRIPQNADRDFLLVPGVLVD